MKKIISLILLLIATLSLISCSCKLHDPLDGEYYWISSERNELAVTIKGDNGTIEHGEADHFTIKQRKRNVCALWWHILTDSTVKYQYKDGIQLRSTYQVLNGSLIRKDSNAYKEALKQFNYK